jgi:hypothetical protein
MVSPVSGSELLLASRIICPLGTPTRSLPAFAIGGELFATLLFSVSVSTSVPVLVLLTPVSFAEPSSSVSVPSITPGDS